MRLMIPALLLGGLLCGAAALGAQNDRSQEDEAWIEEYLHSSSNRAVQAAPVNREPDRVAVSDLSRYVGRDVRLHLSSGRVREGLLESVDGSRLLLRARMPSGYASVSFSSRQILRAELD